MLNRKIILHILGLLMLLNGGFMLLCIPFALVYQEGGFTPMLIGGGFASLFGAWIWYVTRDFNSNLGKREGYIIVSVGWLVMSLTGMIPYIASGVIQSIPSAFFETIAGYTTTGATVLTDIESVPKSILMWRSLTHWIGGMGIIVLAVAILPLLGIGGMQLFAAEAPGPSADKIKPRITDTAKRLWFIYVSLTAIEMVLLMLAGMNFFDAINHAMSTLSTGGFSTKNDSVAGFSPLIQYIIIVFMFLAGVNFSLTYWAVKGKLGRLWANDEFKTYLFTIIGVTLLITLIVHLQGQTALEQSFRDTLFQVVAIITTTGFATADYLGWGSIAIVVFLLLMFTGGSAGSTSGGMKIVRILVIIKNSFKEFRRLLHPSAVIPVRLNGRAVQQNITTNVMAFFIVYLLTFAGGALAMAAIGLDFESAVGASAACVGNIGPGIGDVGPVDNYAWIPKGGQVILSILMLMGRLELFTVVILFTPYFWRKV